MTASMLSTLATVMLGVCVGAAIMSRFKNVAWDVAAFNALVLVSYLQGWI